jgi:hypothetical protein
VLYLKTQTPIFVLVNKLHIKQDTQRMHKITPRSVRVTTADVEEQNITYSECVCVALSYPACNAHALYYAVIGGLSRFTLVSRINLTVDVEEQNITYSKCVSVVLSYPACNAHALYYAVIGGLSRFTLKFFHINLYKTLFSEKRQLLNVKYNGIFFNLRSCF